MWKGASTVRPMRAMLEKNARRLSLHMPGGVGAGRGFTLAGRNPYRLDATELPVTDDLYQPLGAIAESERLVALSAGAAATINLTDGSTAGIHAMLLYAARRGDTVLLARNAHQSAAAACALYGLVAAYIPCTQTADGYAYVTEEATLQALAAHPQACALLLTRPDYYGGLMPLENVRQAARRQGTLLLVDEAHGATLNWDDTLQNALALGADITVQSAHKTLPALTSGAWLHAAPTVDAQRLRRCVRRVQTSSPSFLCQLAMDDARAWMDEHGPDTLADMRAQTARFWRQAERLGYRPSQRLWQEKGVPGAFDPLRLVLDAPQGGGVLARQLAALGCDAEMSDACRVVGILSPTGYRRQLRGLLGALRRIGSPQRAARPTFPPYPPLPEVVLLPAEAMARDSEWAPLAQAVGRVAAEPAGLFPPCVPLVMPGERVTAEAIAALAAAPPPLRFGTKDDEIPCIREDKEN